jgi:DNA-binding transcriptional MerR regulator
MECYTRKQLAAILLVRPRTIIGYEKRGLIKPAFYVSGRPRYTLDGLENLTSENKATIIPDSEQSNP